MSQTRFRAVLGQDAAGVRISGSITNESIEALGLKEGGTAVAVIKATGVMVAVD